MQQKREEDKDFYSAQDIWLIKKDEAAETQQLLDFVNNRLLNDVKISEPLYMIVVKNLVLFVTLGSVVALVIKARPILLTPYVWILIAWGGYVVCTSGFVYLLLSPMPVFRMDTD